MQAISGETYDFSAKPKVVKPRTKYRQQEEEEQEEKLALNNLMFDKRVVRGNTYAAIVTSKNTENLQEATKFSRPLKKKQQPQQQMEQNPTYEPGTPEPAPNRRHVELQTEEFVEQLTDKPPEYEKDTQTDFYIDRPVVRLFLQRKMGIDTETQIWDGDLFDFDYEVEPILQVVVGKTLEQSRMEVLEEEELKVMKEQQKKFEELRNAELAEMQKMEAKEKRLLEESERRKLQHRKKKEQNEYSHQKLISRLIAKNYLDKLKPQCFAIMRDQGVFRNPLEFSLNADFLPWIYEEVQKEIKDNEESKIDVQTVLNDIVTVNVNHHKSNYQAEMDKREQIREQRRLDAIAKEERRIKRAIEKKKRLEQERRMKLRDLANEQLVAKGELKQTILAQNLSDIDNNQQETPSVGLFGGIIGEVVVYCAALKKQAQRDEAYAALRDFLSSTENIVNIFKEILNFVLSTGSVDIGVNEDADGLITAKDENLKLENWALAGEELVPEIYEILKSNMDTPILARLQENCENLGLPADTMDQIIISLLKFYYSADEAVQQKIKFVKVKPIKKYDQVGICYMKPDLAQLQINQKSDRAGQMEEPQNEEEDPKPLPPKNLAESEYLNQCTLYPLATEDQRFLAQHPLAELQIFEEIIKNLALTVKILEGQEFNFLVDSYGDVKEVQTQVMNYIVDDFPVLDMNNY